jgi:hypothetical protein
MCLVLPEIPEPTRGQIRVSHGVGNVFVTEVRLYCAGILAGVRQIETCGVPQHVWMYRKLYTSRFARFRHYVMNRSPCHGPPRSDVNTYGLASPCSRFQVRKARSSGPRKTWVAGEPCLSLVT